MKAETDKPLPLRQELEAVVLLGGAGSVAGYIGWVIASSVLPAEFHVPPRTAWIETGGGLGGVAAIAWLISEAVPALG